MEGVINFKNHSDLVIQLTRNKPVLAILKWFYADMVPIYVESSHHKNKLNNFTHLFHTYYISLLANPYPIFRGTEILHIS
jgi:hypothetical protein